MKKSNNTNSKQSEESGIGMKIFVVALILVLVGAIGFALKGFFELNSIGNEQSQAGEYIDENGVKVVTLGYANGNYYPNVITAKEGTKMRIVADLSQLGGCYTSFTIPSMGINKIFRPGSNEISLSLDKKGTYAFSCFMGMGRGRIVVE